MQSNAHSKRNKNVAKASEIVKKPNTLSFKVKNNSGRRLWVTCFSYLQKQSYSSWRWDKSPILMLEAGETNLVQIDAVYSKDIEKSIFGYLGIFKSLTEAESATYQLLPDAQKLDLDLIYKIGENTVTIDVERYGAEGELFDYQLTGKQMQQLGYQPEIDFFVENRTGKTIFITCFVYDQKDDTIDDAIWKYTKTPIQKLENGDLALIDIASNRDKNESLYVRGTLGIFSEEEEAEANNATFQLIPESKKIMLDRLAALKGKKIVLNVEKYGSQGDFIDYVIKTKARRLPEESVDN